MAASDPLSGDLTSCIRFADGRSHLLLVLRVLAELDLSFESDLEVVRHSSTDEALKREVIDKLHQKHREKRRPYVQQLAELQLTLAHTCAWNDDRMSGSSGKYDEI